MRIEPTTLRDETSSLYHYASGWPAGKEQTGLNCDRVALNQLTGNALFIWLILLLEKWLSILVISAWYGRN
jgi:hypothetical protein